MNSRIPQQPYRLGQELDGLPRLHADEDFKLPAKFEQTPGHDV